eukprot:4956181-Prymnesium_polylepis.1
MACSVSDWSTLFQTVLPTTVGCVTVDRHLVEPPVGRMIARPHPPGVFVPHDPPSDVRGPTHMPTSPIQIH